MKLLNGYILIRADAEKRETDSGILLSENATRLPQTGVIEAVADGIQGLKSGDRVAFLRYASIDFDPMDLGMRLCKLEHIVGVYDKTAA